jgi:hypothetical protein
MGPETIGQVSTPGLVYASAICTKPPKFLQYPQDDNLLPPFCGTGGGDIPIVVCKDWQKAVRSSTEGGIYSLTITMSQNISAGCNFPLKNLIHGFKLFLKILNY